MKTKLYILIALAALSLNANALIYYVDGSKADDSGTGFSWALAKKNIGTVINLNLTSADTVFVKAGTYSYSATSGTAFNTLGVKPVNLFGGFAGTEGRTTQRNKSDKDGNGKIEPWEFTHETVLSFNITDANGLGLYAYQNGVSLFDGFVITGSSTFTIGAANTSKAAIGIYGNWIFRNNTVRNWSIVASLNATGTSNVNAEGALLKVYSGGTSPTLYGNCKIEECLFEKNRSTITATSVPNSDNRQAPFIRIPGSTATDLGANVMRNTVIRNNKTKIDYSAATGITTNATTRGFLVDFAPGGKTDGTISAPTVVKNNLIYNNDAEFVATYNAVQGGVVGALPINGSVTDSVLNNTIANNKLTRLGAALSIAQYSATLPYHKVINNAVYNNTNFDGTNTVQANIFVSTAPDNTVAGSEIFNNVCSGGTTNLTNNSSNTATTNVYGNVLNLATTNTGTNAPYFVAPTSFIGANQVAGSADSIAIAQSNWRINSQSYLIAKGKVTSNKTDKAGLLYSTSNPSVGTFEGGSLTNIWEPTYTDKQFVKVIGNTIYIDVNSPIEVYDVYGRLVVKKTSVNPLVINQRGAFVVKTTESNLNLIQKIIIY
jgi:hypothetical protein